MNRKCQVFTPENYVDELLNCVDYETNIFGKKILENSCGDGNILTSIVKRYINDCMKQKIPKNEIQEGLARDIYGFEIDSEQVVRCIDKLNKILNDYDLDLVEWNIHVLDYIKWDTDIKFDYIIGNPPYIAYSDLKLDDRIYLRENFISCKKGKFDYCYAFIEKSLKQLNERGKMSYLIPSSIFKTVFGENLRNIMKQYIVEIKDYRLEKIFNTALVKSSIILFHKNNNLIKSIKYKEMSNKKIIHIPI